MGSYSITLHWKVIKFHVKCHFDTQFNQLSTFLFSHTLRNLNDWTIQLGMTRRHSHAHYGQKIKVKKVIPHPQYNDLVAHDNDIALFQVRKNSLEALIVLLFIEIRFAFFPFAARYTRRISRSFIAGVSATNQYERACCWD